MTNFRIASFQTSKANSSRHQLNIIYTNPLQLNTSVLTVKRNKTLHENFGTAHSWVSKVNNLERDWLRSTYTVSQ